MGLQVSLQKEYALAYTVIASAGCTTMHVVKAPEHSCCPFVTV